MFQEWAEAAGIPRKPLYRAAEVARVLGISRSTVYTEIASGRLRAKRPTKSGYCVYVMGDDVDEWLEGEGNG
uniref:Helix-turn-helix domain protein n=1 Tax=Myoviridae sp. ctPkm1 TaxID=2825099 RepID=A0A8S5TYA8_9CAUD|nr:MAG TPA: helix-turn-helix domain protein [Myoviridae sp. ctPkm1]